MRALSCLVGCGARRYRPDFVRTICQRCGAWEIARLLPGSFSLVDARDVARAQISAAERGQRGERYLAAGRHMTMQELVPLLGRSRASRRPQTTCLSCFCISAAAQEVYAKISGKPILLSLATVRLMRKEAGRSHFIHTKSEQKLQLKFRPIEQTLPIRSLGIAAMAGYPVRRPGNAVDLSIARFLGSRRTAKRKDYDGQIDLESLDAAWSRPSCCGCAARIRCTGHPLSEGRGQHGRVLQERTGGVSGGIARMHPSFKFNICWWLEDAGIEPSTFDDVVGTLPQHAGPLEPTRQATFSKAAQMHLEQARAAEERGDNASASAAYKKAAFYLRMNRLQADPRGRPAGDRTSLRGPGKTAPANNIQVWRKGIRRLLPCTAEARRQQ